MKDLLGILTIYIVNTLIHTHTYIYDKKQKTIYFNYSKIQPKIVQVSNTDIPQSIEEQFPHKCRNKNVLFKYETPQNHRYQS